MSIKVRYVSFAKKYFYPLFLLSDADDSQPAYIRIFWSRDIASYLAKEKRLFTLIWLVALATLLAVLCIPFETKYIAGYLVSASPVHWIFLSVGEISYSLLNLSWATTVLFLLTTNC